MSLREPLPCTQSAVHGRTRRRTGGFWTNMLHFKGSTAFSRRVLLLLVCSCLMRPACERRRMISFIYLYSSWGCTSGCNELDKETHSLQTGVNECPQELNEAARLEPIGPNPSYSTARTHKRHHIEVWLINMPMSKIRYD